MDYNLSDDHPLANISPLMFINWFHSLKGDIFNNLISIVHRDIKSLKNILSINIENNQTEYLKYLELNKDVTVELIDYNFPCLNDYSKKYIELSFNHEVLSNFVVYLRYQTKIKISITFAFL